MKQTSIEWLKKELEDYGSPSHLNLDWETFDELIEQAKEMHKQEIIDAHIEGQRVFDKHDHTQWTTDQAEQYYQETLEEAAEKEFPLLDTKWCRNGAAEEENLQLLVHRRSFIKGAKWYREQLKQRQ